MRRVAVSIIIVMVALPIAAEPISDASIARQAAALFRTIYPQTGMTGLNQEVQSCYAQGITRKSVSTIERCVILDVMTGDFDRAYLKQINMEQEASSQNSPTAIRARLQVAFSALKLGPEALNSKLEDWLLAAQLAERHYVNPAKRP